MGTTIEAVVAAVATTRKFKAEQIADRVLPAVTRWFESEEAREKGAQWADSAAARYMADCRSGYQDCGQRFAWDAEDVAQYHALAAGERKLAALIRTIPSVGA